MNYFFLIGRILFGGFFLYNAYRHLFHGKGMVGYAQMKSVPYPALSVFVSGLLLLIGGLSVILGVDTTLGLVAIIAFLVPVTFSMHAHWKVADAGAKAMEKIQFHKNLALLGAALMMLLIPTPWPLSL